MVTFPIINVRRNVDGSWSLVYKVETVTVPSSAPYVIQLEEVPDNGVIEDPPVIPGLTISETYPPNPGHCYINYANGYIEFNLSQAGNTYTVSYWGKGYLMDADHINWLYDNKIDVDGTAEAGDIAVFLDNNTIIGTKSIDLGTF